MSRYPYAIQASLQHRRRAVALLRLKANQPYYQKLLKQAQKAAKAGDSQMAIIYSQAAAELCTESAISDLLVSHGVTDLKKPLFAMFRSFDPGNDQLRVVYNSLSGDRLEKTPFWKAFQAHRKARNNIVHKGERCSADQANSSVVAVSDLVKHIESKIQPKKGHR